jgi:RNA polymerase sigma-70 factor (ECF subfamily)
VDAESAGRELARRLADGDADAVRDVYRAYGRLAFAIAYKVLRDAGLAEDAVQTAFTKLWRSAATVDPERDIRPLLFTIVRRCAFDLAARGRRETVVPLTEAYATAADDSPDLDRLWTTWTVREAIGSLPEAERHVVRLQHLDGMTHADIAQRLNVAVGTVKSRSFRAHKRLCSLLSSLRDEVS